MDAIQPFSVLIFLLQFSSSVVVVSVVLADLLRICHFKPLVQAITPIQLAGPFMLNH